MASYDTLGKYYDSIMGDQRASAQAVRKLLWGHHPRARTLLDLACGTGSILAHLARRYEVAGLDLSPVLLAMARKKLPRTPLYEGDMKSFDLGGSFDAVVCLLDSINHLRKFSDWQRVFVRVHRHLNPSGIFVFDINTERKLERLVSTGPRIHQFQDHLMIVNTTAPRDNLTAWHLRVFEPIGEGLYRSSEETIVERSFPLMRIRNALREAGFKPVKTFDLERGSVSARSERVHFVCRK